MASSEVFNAILALKRKSAKLDDINKRSFLFSPLERPASVGRRLEADAQPNFVAQLSGHKNLYHSISLKRQREMSAIMNREPGTITSA